MCSVVKNKNMKYVYGILYIAVFIVVSVPVLRNYVMESGDIQIWQARIEEMLAALKAGQFLLFPSAELTVTYGAQISALHTNLWLLLPVLIRILGGTISVACRIYMLLLNFVTLLTAKKMFGELFEDKKVVAIGVFLYMTCPYRAYMCYEKVNLGLVAAWSLIPLVVWGMLKIRHVKMDWKEILVSGLAFAAIGYADGIMFLVTMGVLVIGVLWYKNMPVLFSMAIGGVVYLPGAIYFVRYIIKGGMEVWSLPLGSIASNGYVLEQFFSSWVYRADYPGLGLGLMITLMVLLWISFTEGNLQIMKKYGYFVIILLLLSFMSMQAFPWDVVQRVGTVFLRLVPLMETPGICFGFASLAASVLGAYGVECAMKQIKLT